MERRELRDFLESKKKYTEQEILASINSIKEYLLLMYISDCRIPYIKKLFEFADKNKVLYELFKDEEKFSLWKEKLDIPETLKFGLELEVAQVQYEEIKSLIESNLAFDIMTILGVPKDISEKITENSDFKKKNESHKWIFSEEPSNISEASTPIMQNNLEDLNQVIAICTLYKALGGNSNNATGLHINIGADYFECNQKALDNFLEIWGECEELFFKVANPDGESIRYDAFGMAFPVKENIQKFFEKDGSVSLNTDEDMEKFIYQIQARNRMYSVLGHFWMDFGHGYDDLEYELAEAHTEEEKLDIYRRYHRLTREHNVNSKVRWTSVNFNHMDWNSENPGRIEIRFWDMPKNLNPNSIFEDLTFISKLCEVSLLNAKNPEYKKAEFERVRKHDISEAKKVDAMLDLILDNPELKSSFKTRWRTTRGNKEYKKFISGTDTFVR